MNAGALHTIITDEVWHPERAAKRGKNSDGLCLLCKCGKRADFNTYGGNVKPATNTNYNWIPSQEIKKDMNFEPQCLWTTG
eukprot:10913146-Heterocapsa_arctica.AAC.1